MTKQADDNQTPQIDREDAGEIYIPMRYMAGDDAATIRAPLWRPALAFLLQVLIASAAVIGVVLMVLLWWPGIEKPFQQLLASETETNNQAVAQASQLSAAPAAPSDSAEQTIDRTDVMRNELALMVSQNSELRSQLGSINDTLAALISERDQLRQMVGSSAPASERIAIAAETVTADKASAAPQAAANNNANVMANAEYLANQEQRISELENALESVESINQKLNSTMAERDELALKVAMLESNNTNAAEQLDELKSLIQSKEEQLGKQQQHIEQLMQRQDEIAGKAMNLPPSSANPESQTMALQQELESMRMEVKRRTRLLNLLAQKRDVDFNAVAANTNANGSEIAIASNSEKTLDSAGLDTATKSEPAPDAGMPALAKLSVPQDLAPQAVKATDSEALVDSAAESSPDSQVATIVDGEHSKPNDPPANHTQTPAAPAKPTATRLQEIHFTSNGAALNDLALRKIQLAVDALKQRLPDAIKVVGFSDTAGNADYNRALSKKRAQAVADMLINNGITKDRIQVIGKGEDGAPKDENGVPRILPDNTVEPLNRCVGILAVNNDDSLPLQSPISTSGTAPEPTSTPAEQPAAIRLEEIHFTKNGAVLDDLALRKTQRAIEALKQRLPDQIKIVGFSDTAGNADYNRALSKKRAQAVADMLIKAGIAKDRIEVIGKGEDGAPKDENGVPRILPDNTVDPLNRCVGILAVNATQ